jgi:antitoxin component of MazEF toxin-antitoxin module
MKFKGKVWKTGNSFVITVPQQYVEDGIFKQGETYDVEVTEMVDPEMLADAAAEAAVQEAKEIESMYWNTKGEGYDS